MIAGVLPAKNYCRSLTIWFHPFLETDDYFITGNNDIGDNLSATTVLLTPAMKHLNKISLPTP
jgi:hypothetical protein